jgi:hypothetical protein
LQKCLPEVVFKSEQVAIKSDQSVLKLVGNYFHCGDTSNSSKIYDKYWDLKIEPIWLTNAAKL